MSLLASLLDPGFRQAASVVIEVGQDGRDLGDLATLISEISIEASRAEAATGTITFDDRRKEDGEWMAADSGFFARWEPIKVSADFQTHIDEIFRGYIIELKPTAPQNGGEAKLVLELQDDGAALNREQVRRVFGEDAPMTDRAILEELVAPLPVTVSSDSGDGQNSRSLAMDASAIQFLRERAIASGYEMIFDRGEVYFGPWRLEGDPQATIMIYAGTATNCLNWELSDSADHPDVVVFEIAPRDEGADPVVEEVTTDLPVLGTTPASAEGAGLGTPAVRRVSREGDEPEEATRARAQAMVNEHAFRIRATGELDGTLYGHVLRVARLVRVDGVGSRNGGLYYVDKVTHVFTPEGYRQRFELIRNATGDSDAPSAPLDAAVSAISSLF